MNINQLFRVYMNEAGDGNGGGGDAGAGGDGGKGGQGGDAGAGGGNTGLMGAHADAEARKAAEAAAAASGKPARPDDVPEQFWDVEKGAVKHDALLKSWKDTRTALETAKKGQQGAEKPPAKAEDYKFNLPAGDDGKPVALHVEPNDEAVKLAQKAAHAAGMSQATFDKFMGAFITGAMPLMPGPVDMDAEKKLIGPNADAVISAVHAWGKNLVDTGLWSKDEFQEIIYMGSTAVGVRALNKLRESMGEKPIPVDGPVGDSLPSKEELYSMVNDPKYQSDPAFRADVDKKFKLVFGDQPAGSSEAGLGVRVQPRVVSK